MTRKELENIINKAFYHVDDIRTHGDIALDMLWPLVESFDKIKGIRNSGVKPRYMADKYANIAEIALTKLQES